MGHHNGCSFLWCETWIAWEGDFWSAHTLCASLHPHNPSRAGDSLTFLFSHTHTKQKVKPICQSSGPHTIGLIARKTGPIKECGLASRVSHKLGSSKESSHSHTTYPIKWYTSINEHKHRVVHPMLPSQQYPLWWPVVLRYPKEPKDSDLFHSPSLPS